MIKKKFIVLFVLFSVLVSAFAKTETSEQNPIEELSFLNGQPLGINTGTIFDQLTSKVFPDSEIRYFKSYADVLIALSEGKISGFMCDSPMLNSLIREGYKIKILDTVIERDNFGFSIGKTDRGKSILLQMNEFLKESQKNGLLKELDEKWMIGDFSNQSIDVELTGENGVLHAATDFGYTPFTMYVNNKPAGYETELLYQFCKAYGYSLEFEVITFDGLIPSIVSGKNDIAFSGMSITEERKKSVYMTDSTYEVKVMMAVNDNTSEETEEKGFWDSLKESFNKNFIYENRYLLIVSGLLVTLKISIMSALFGTVVGFLLCMQRRSKIKILSGCAAFFIRLIQGMPVVIFLMILYYIIFGNSKISSVTIAIVGFSINFGVYVSEMMRSGIDAVDKGQIEAALAIGFNPLITFIRITLPQAARHFIPVFKGEFIAMVKMTSVVGYIAIQDLTKASDIIRSRTFEAFFPLIFTAIIYFIISYLFVFILNRIELNLDPKHRRRSIKGVVTE